jgi:hypothetical protein
VFGILKRFEISKSSHAVKLYVQNKSLAIEYECNFPAGGPCIITNDADDNW